MLQLVQSILQLQRLQRRHRRVVFVNSKSPTPASDGYIRTLRATGRITSGRVDTAAFVVLTACFSITAAVFIAGAVVGGATVRFRCRGGSGRRLFGSAAILLCGNLSRRRLFERIVFGNAG